MKKLFAASMIFLTLVTVLFCVGSMESDPWQSKWLGTSRYFVESMNCSDGIMFAVGIAAPEARQGSAPWVWAEDAPGTMGMNFGPAIQTGSFHSMNIWGDESGVLSLHTVYFRWFGVIAAAVFFHLSALSGLWFVQRRR